MKNIICLFMLLSFLGCNKEDFQTTTKDPIEIVPNPNPDIKLVLWQIPLTEDTSGCFSIDTELINDGILFSADIAGQNKNEPLKMVDKNDGSLIWEWEKYIAGGAGQPAMNVKLIDNNILVMNSWEKNYGIDINTGQTVWASINDEGYPRISSFENLIFHTSTYGPAPTGDSTNIWVCDGQLGDWQEVIKFYKTDEYEVICGNPSAYTDSRGDIILFFKVTEMDISPYDVKANFYCYNMTKGRLLWQRKDFAPAGESNHNPPLIDGDYVYHVGVREVFCFDKHTGETVWQWGFPYESWTFFATDYLTHEDKFIISRSNGDLFAVDKLTGAVLWVIKDHKAGFTPQKMTVHNDKLYYGSGDFYIIDINEGKVFSSFPSPNTFKGFDAVFRNGVAIDSVNKRMYTTDEYFLYCMKLIE